MMSILSREDVQHFYDRFGAKQDQQGFYEDAALDALIQHGAFSDAQSVLEIGCGTGRLASRLLSDYLPPSAHYVGIDISATMVGLAEERLKSWAERAGVHLSSGNFDYSSYGGRFDRIVSTYVYDLLSYEEIDEVLEAAHSAVITGGFLCVAGLTKGTGLISAATSAAWTLVHSLKPSLVGGCRPIILSDFLPEHQWRIVHREVIVRATISSEVVVAEAF